MPGSNERLVDVVTPLGDKLWFRQMSGTEALSTLFDFDVTFHSDKKEIKAKTMLGLGVTLKVETQDLGVRHFNGICTRFSSGGKEGDHYVYTAKLRPWLWLASRRSDCKIFQNKTVPQIIDDVLKDSGEYDFPIKQNLIKTYREWEYCVQYQETDLNFVMRLMEHEGIYFYFKHDDGVHTLTLVDDMSRHLPMPERPTIIYSGVGAAAVEREEHFDSWHLREEVDSGEYGSDDYDFMKPNANLKTANASPMGHAEDGRQRYEWPGGYIVHSDGDQYARVRMETLVAEQERALGHCSLRTMAPGYTFNLERCPQREQNREYLAVAATYFFRDNVRRTVGSGDGDVTWGISVTSQPTAIPYRPQLLTPKPRTHGPQTALVVGPHGQEIHTEKYGRVKVQFHWDRVGQNNQHSSCFIRVGTPLAGGKWGMIQVPRIGQEVIVDFLCGDPDQPIIIGSVYNEAQPVPYELPKYEAFSTWKSHSTPGGNPNDYNELRFDDRIGKEQVFIRAQKRMDVRVKQNQYVTVQASRNLIVGGGDAQSVGGSRDVKVKGDLILRADGKIHISSGGEQATLAEGDYKLSSYTKIDQKAPKITIDAAASLTLRVGGNFITIDPSGVKIQGTMVLINSGGAASPVPQFTVDDPYEPGAADTGEPGYLDNLPKGGWKGKRKSRQAIKSFASADEAAVDQMQQHNPTSVKQNLEHGGWIKKNPDGSFSAQPAVVGTPAGLSNIPAKGPDDVAWWHTHAATDPALITPAGNGNEVFSGNTGDKGFSKANNAPGYLATPTGVIRRYDPATDTVTDLPDTAPP